MDSGRYQFMNMSEKPGRLNNIEAAWYLGFAAHDIPVLIANKMFKPLGDPPPKGGRYFACSDLEGTARTMPLHANVRQAISQLLACKAVDPLFTCQRIRVDSKSNR